jgi:hypothetical protein
MIRLSDETVTVASEKAEWYNQGNQGQCNIKHAP